MKNSINKTTQFKLSQNGFCYVIGINKIIIIQIKLICKLVLTY